MENEKVAAAAELALKRINELEAENDRLRHDVERHLGIAADLANELAQAEADKLEAVKRAIERAADTAFWHSQSIPISKAIRDLPADEIATRRRKSNENYA